MILMDFSQIMFSTVMVHFKNEARSDNPNGLSLIRHMVLSTILSYKKKYAEQYGELVLAIDNRNYWRRNVFPYYKGKRKEQREKSGMDWDFIFKALDTVKAELKENFPYKLVEADGAEADDVIACITKYLQSNELSQSGLFTEPQPIMIVSADTDFCQLQKYPNVSQFSPMQKKAVKPDGTVDQFIMEHICTGDTGDGIANICSPDNSFVDGIRQKPFKKSRLLEFYTQGIDACADETERRNFQRNRTLIDFDYIPADVNARVIDAYISQTPVRNKQKVMNYLMKNRMKQLMDNVSEF